jgi:hypothetical protein
VTRAYFDGSATKNESYASFGVHFPELPVTEHRRDIKSRILGHQTIARAEALGILAALLASRRDTNCHAVGRRCRRESGRGSADRRHVGRVRLDSGSSIARPQASVVQCGVTGSAC